MTGRMQGKVALVTGAARGQGRSHAVRLAQEGADIIAVDICDQIESTPYPMATTADLAETGKLVEQLDRRVVTEVGSMAGLMPGAGDPGSMPGAAGYAHAKRAVARFTHDLALALAPHSIRVNAIHPGNINTDMLQNDAMYKLFRPDLENPTRADAEPAFGAMHKLPVNTLDPADISEAVLYLASDASRYVTGQQLKVDAGALLPLTNSGAPA